MSTNESTGVIILSPRLIATGAPAGKSLENIITNPIANGALCYVETGAGQGEWQLQKEATDAPDGVTIVKPIGGPGRWFKKLDPGAGGGSGSGVTSISGTDGIVPSFPQTGAATLSGINFLLLDGTRPMTGNFSATTITASGSVTAPDFNGVPLVSGGDPSLFLNEAGNYVAVPGGGNPSQGTNTFNVSDGSGGWTDTAVTLSQAATFSLVTFGVPGGTGPNKASTTVFGDNSLGLSITSLQSAAGETENTFSFNAEGPNAINRINLPGSAGSALASLEINGAGIINALDSTSNDAGRDLLIRGGNGAIGLTSDGGELALYGGAPGTGGGTAGSLKLGTATESATWPSANGVGVLTNDGSGLLTWAASPSGNNLQQAYDAGPTIVTSSGVGALQVSGTEQINLISGGGQPSFALQGNDAANLTLSVSSQNFGAGLAELNITAEDTVQIASINAAVNVLAPGGAGINTGGSSASDIILSLGGVNAGAGNSRINAGSDVVNFFGFNSASSQFIVDDFKIVTVDAPAGGGTLLRIREFENLQVSGSSSGTPLLQINQFDGIGINTNPGGSLNIGSDALSVSSANPLFVGADGSFGNSGEYLASDGSGGTIWKPLDSFPTIQNLDADDSGVTLTASQNTVSRIGTGGGTFNLPAASVGLQIRVKDVAGTANTSSITVNAVGGETIDGATSIEIATNFGSKTFFSDGSSWDIL